MKAFRLTIIFFFAAALLVFISCEDDVVSVDDPAEIGLESRSGANNSTVPTVVLGLTPDVAGNTFITSNRTLYRDTCYILNQFIRVPSGVTLTIQSGTTIKGREGFFGNPHQYFPPGILIVEKGGKIQANGTATEPILFTSEAFSPRAGDWGGVIILGRAPVSLPGGEGEIEVFNDFTGDNRYGGNNPNDDSGSLSYVRIEYSGGIITFGDETNGLTLGGVGRGTTIDHVQVSFGADDGFEFLGGTVNASYLVSSRNTDDDFDTNFGYNGNVQFGVVLRDPNRFAQFPTTGFESNGDNDDNNVNFTNATFSNFTIIGPIGPNSTASISFAYASGVWIRDASELDLFNSIIVGFPRYQLEVETGTSKFDADSNDATDDKVSIEGTTLVFPTFGVYNAKSTNLTCFTLSGYFNLAREATVSGTGGPNTLTAHTGLNVAAWNLTNPNFVPDLEVISDFSNDVLDTFFDKTVDFRGAFGQDSEAEEGTNWNFDSWTDF